MEENEPVLMRGVGYHLLGGPRVLGTDVGKLVEKVEKAMRAEAAGESVEEEEEEQDEDEEDEEREERERLRELENWDKRGPGSAGKEAKPPGVAVGSVPYAGYFALPTRRMGLLEYYRRHVAAEGTVPEAGDGVPYVFEKNPRVTRDGLSMVSQILELVFYREDRERDGMVCPVAGGRNGAGESVHFYLGRKGSGAPTHIHADAINFLVKGWKRWFVHPPLQSLYSRTPVPFYPSLLSEHYPTHPKPLECVQKPGDAFFVPFDWGHGVLNEADEVEARLNPKNAGTNFGYAVELVNRRSVGALPVPGGKKGRGGWGCE
ncbi:hypothetical protein DFJ74DRAFT_697306 [Hyaloraphidium curvatum]|nr:hypothetical protein DFJ74DRAFT_697306 [Hyaloraphidium curvatum]